VGPGRADPPPWRVSVAYSAPAAQPGQPAAEAAPAPV